MFKQLKPKARFMLISITVAATLGFFGFVIFYYALPTIIQESNTIEQTKTTLAAMEEKKNILLAEEEKIKSLSAKLDAIDAAIVPANNPVTFLGSLERMADHERLSIEIRPAPGVLNASPNALALIVSVTGALKQGIDFIKNISLLPFVITISDVALSRSITAASSETKPNAKTITPVLGETIITVTLFAASHP